MPFGMPQVRRNARFEHLGLHGLEHAGLVGAPKAPGIHRDEHVGGAELALVDDALDEAVARTPR